MSRPDPQFQRHDRVSLDVPGPIGCVAAVIIDIADYDAVWLYRIDRVDRWGFNPEIVPEHRLSPL